ncbi:SAV_915 family protein [Saccharopolyspora sp. 5N102]|uniref:SAV_915 family protein n=1 Tax=Saccharopolyspora sp. 5N102 TaxID=3375155 RepID=UPI0037B20799
MITTDALFTDDIPDGAPAVFEPDADPGDAGNPLVYLPTQRLWNRREELLFIIAADADGPVLPVYSSAAALVAGCGTDQPWVAVPATRLSEMARLCGTTAMSWDQELCASGTELPR